MLVSVVPGLLAAAAIIYAIRVTRKPTVQARHPLRFQIRPVLKGELGRLFVGIGAFEIGNVAATVLILRAFQLEHGRNRAMIALTGRSGARQPGHACQHILGIDSLLVGETASIGRARKHGASARVALANGSSGTRYEGMT